MIIELTNNNKKIPEDFTLIGKYYGMVGNFYICKHTVTQEEYVEVMGGKQERIANRNIGIIESGENKIYIDLSIPNIPITVSWYDAILYCNKKSKKDGLIPYYKLDYNVKEDSSKKNFKNTPTTRFKVSKNKNGNGYRLPEGFEWSIALGDRLQAFFYNYDFSKVDDYIWSRENSDKKIHPVMQKKANEYGLYDMMGNVWQWISDVSTENEACDEHYHVGGDSFIRLSEHATELVENYHINSSLRCGFRLCL